jgi:hypothetical protein
MDPVRVIQQYGFLGTLQKTGKLLASVPRKLYYQVHHRNATEYRQPSPEELATIEQQLQENGVLVKPLTVDPETFTEFRNRFVFPDNYHGGIDGPVWDEKILEHYLAYELAIKHLPENNKYIDIAAFRSPWTSILREQHIDAYAIDMEVPDKFSGLDYYIQTDATDTPFDSDSIGAASLQCAFEMFRDDDDMMLIRELSRILIPGGKAIISPLYMHTHYCSYSSPDYLGKGYSDPEATEYINRSFFGIPSSRKYNAEKLKTRVLDTIKAQGMEYSLYRITNKSEISPSVYCHFVLEITK